MPFTEASLKAFEIPDAHHALRPDECILYSLSVGLGADPMDQRQLRYVYEDELCANPLMANVLAYPGFWMRDKAAGVNWEHVLHGEQFFELHRPIPTTGELVGSSKVIGVNDRGEKGAFVYSRREVIDQSTNELICTIDQTTVCRANGGSGGVDKPPRPAHMVPETKPDMQCDLPISNQAALLYRLNGDRNPLHADPKVAAQAGYSQPILHGLCTLGFAGHAILRTVCDYDASRFRSMAARFTSPVYPGETLRTEIWNEDDGVSFRSRVVERDTVVLGNGKVTLN